MLVSDWPRAFSHVDADAFYASCEQVRHPELRGRPLCVLSNQEAFVIAKTYDAKAAGVTTGMSVWDLKKLLPDAVMLPADFHFYGQMSDKMFAILRRYCPEVEVYSIDEGFLDMGGLRTLWRGSYAQIADKIRDAVRQEVGITVSVGVAVTRTLAKMASESHKPDGTTTVPGRRIETFLTRIKIGDVPGIGGNRVALLHKFGIRIALEFIQAPMTYIRRLMGRLGVDLWHELRGESVYPLELKPKLPKSVARTASIGPVTADSQVIASHLTVHVSRLAIELVTKRYVAESVTVFLREKSFESRAAEYRLPHPSNNYHLLAQAASGCLERLYRAGVVYRGCGVIATRISRIETVTADLFGMIERDQQQAGLFKAVDQINRKFGDGKAVMAGAMQIRHKGKTTRFKYPMFAAN